MALKPSNRHTPALDVLQVIEARKLYYLENETYQTIADNFGTTRRVVEKAVQGIGKFYSSINDDIDDHTKYTRVPAREKYSIRQLKKEYVSSKLIELDNGEKVYTQKYNAMNGWSAKQKERFKESERIAQERAKKFGY